MGNRTLKEGRVEVKLRSNLEETIHIERGQLASEVVKLIRELEGAILSKVRQEATI